MEVREKVKQRGHEYLGLFQCEECGSTYRAYGNDSYDFETRVLPQKKCPNCHKSSLDLIYEAVENLFIIPKRVGNEK